MGSPDRSSLHETEKRCNAIAGCSTRTRLAGAAFQAPGRVDAWTYTAGAFRPVRHCIKSLKFRNDAALRTLKWENFSRALTVTERYKT